MADSTEKVFFQLNAVGRADFDTKVAKLNDVQETAIIPDVDESVYKGFVVFGSPEAAAAALATLKTMDGVTVSDKLIAPKKKGNHHRNYKDHSAPPPSYAEGMFVYPHYQPGGGGSAGGAARTGRRKQQPKEHAEGGASGEEGAEEERRSEEGADGNNRFRRGGGRGRGRGRGGRGRYQNNLITGYAAIVTNVPLCATNTQLAEMFEAHGQIFDIERWECNAMVYYDSEEAVTRAVCAFNGTMFMGGNISVSRGEKVNVRLPMM